MIKKVTHCRICKNSDLYTFLLLGKIPLPNEFIPEAKLTKKEKKYPLNVCMCRTCGLAQLTDIVDPEEMFRNYVYIPSSSKTRMKNFESIALEAKKRVPLDEKSLVIDIGSNDGSLLSYFKAYGIKTLGIDPAVNLAKVAQLKGIETINEFVSVKTARKIRKSRGKAKIITATNVVAHINDLYDLFKAVEILLDERGLFICEFPYLLDLIEKNQFDTIYHEHLSYFSVKPLVYLLNRVGLHLADIQRTSIDGGSLRVFIAHGKNAKNDQLTQKLIKAEEAFGLYDEKSLTAFAKRVKELRKDLIQTLKKLKSQGKTIAAFGAAAKGNILLNYCHIGKALIDFAVDSTPYKQGLYTPGSHIRIYPENEIMNRMPDYTLIMAWNFAKEIIEKEKKYAVAGGKFIIPVPKVTIL